MLNETMPEKGRELSPMEKLTDKFKQQNGHLEELIMRLQSKGHHLSDTNVPKADNANKETRPELPFMEGRLMEYYYQLNRNEGLLDALRNEVVKMEGLI